MVLWLVKCELSLKLKTNTIHSYFIATKYVLDNVRVEYIHN